MYKVASISHTNQTLTPVSMLWCPSCSSQVRSRGYLLFCTVKAGRQSWLGAVATALQLLSKSSQRSLWKGSRGPSSSPFHPSPLNTSTQSPTWFVQNSGLRAVL